VGSITARLGAQVLRGGRRCGRRSRPGLGQLRGGTGDASPGQVLGAGPVPASRAGDLLRDGAGHRQRAAHAAPGAHRLGQVRHQAGRLDDQRSGRGVPEPRHRGLLRVDVRVFHQAPPPELGCQVPVGVGLVQVVQVVIAAPGGRGRAVAAPGPGELAAIGLGVGQRPRDDGFVACGEHGTGRRRPGYPPGYYGNGLDILTGQPAEHHLIPATQVHPGGVRSLREQIEPGFAADERAVAWPHRKQRVAAGLERAERLPGHRTPPGDWRTGSGQPESGQVQAAVPSGRAPT
jgi:hypothetical protein